MNCWRCACMFEASLWNKAPSASGGLTAGENLIRHFKDSSHWSLTKNKTDQTSLSRNERERALQKITLWNVQLPRVSSSVADDPQRANSVYVCATCASGCVLQISKRLCGYINSGSTQMSVFSGVDHYLWWLILIHWELPSIPSSELSVFGLVQWTCEINVICLRDVRQLSFCLGQYLPCHHLE